MPIAPGLGSPDEADPRPDPPTPPPAQDRGDPIPEAEATAARISTADRPLGRLGARFDRRSPFFIGAAGAAGVACTYAVVRLLITASPVLVLIGLALFLALGLDPVASWLVAHRLSRWLAVTIVFTTALALTVGFFAVAIPPLVTQGRELIDRAPDYLRQLQDHSSVVGRLNDRFHLQDRLASAAGGNGQAIVGDAVTAGTAVVGALGKIVILAVLTVYFLANLPQIRATGYRLIPHSRRPRAILIGDQILAKVGAYVLGNVLISVIAGIATAIWLLVFGVPYALFLGVFVALLDLVPVVGSTIAGIVVAAVALTVSLPVCIATAVFFIAFRLAEDYLLVPRIIGRTVHVPALTTVVAVLIGGTLLGIVGALVAIPVAAAFHLLAEEILFPRLDAA